MKHRTATFSPWLTAAPYGISMSLGAGLAYLLLLPGSTGMTALIIVGLLSLPLTLLSTMARIARDDSFPEDDPRDVVPFAFSLSSTLLIALPLLSVFGATLKSQTHHRALGAVTFSILGLGLLLGVTGVGRRIGALVRGGLFGRSAPWILVVVWGLSLVVVLSFLSRAGWSHARRSDTLLLLLAPALGALAPPVQRRGIGISAWGMSLVLSAFAWLMLARSSPQALALPVEKGGLAAEIFSTLHMFTESSPATVPSTPSPAEPPAESPPPAPSH